MTHRQPSGGTAIRRRAATALAMVSLLGAVGIGRADAQIVIPIGGQSSNVANNGGAQANTGGNSSTANSSSNTATSTVGSQGGGGLLGTLVGVNLGLGAPTNTSTGTSNITTGPATATGNQSGTGVGQSSTGGGGTSRFAPAPVQSSGVVNEGAASANTGGNSGVGNSSENTATNNLTSSGGLVNAVVNLGGPTNNSSGTSNITTGPASAIGNVADTTVEQTRVGGHGVDGQGLTFVPGVGFVPTAGLGGDCSGRGGQRSSVVNRGEAVANTGNNTSVGNSSRNVATNNQTISGGLIGLGINIGGPTNNSDGTSTIVTGPAVAVGNQSTTAVDQTCVGFVPVAARHRTTVGHVRTATVTPGTLARTGAEAPDLALMAAALLFGGSVMVLPARRRRQQMAVTAVAEVPSD